MLNVKTFKDGERFIVCIEGNPTGAKSLIKNICSSLIDCEYEEISEANVIPIPECEEDIPVPETEASKEETPTVVYITDGNYAGKTPFEIVTGENPKENEKAFKELVVLRHNCEEPLKTDINKAIMTYVKTRFSAITDVNQFCTKLNLKQLANFFDDTSFGDIIPKKKKAEFTKEAGYNSWDDFVNILLECNEDCLENARGIAQKVIEMFAR